MYPLEDGQTYPRNEWYIAFWSDDVGREPVERKILEDIIVFYRTERGTPIALAGLCQHRGFPLAKGKLVGDQLVCGYHGFTYNEHGTCVTIPSQDRVPPRYTAQKYPVVEKWQWIWIWMGAPELADPAKIPDMEHLGLTLNGWQADKVATYSLQARYQMLIDNLMDLSHVSFVHAASVRGGDHIIQTPAVLTESGGTLNVSRHFPPELADPFKVFLHPDLEGQFVQMSLVTEYKAPNVVQSGGLYMTGQLENVPRKVHFVHGFTPETPTSTHYFTAVSRDFRLADEGLSHALVGLMSQVVQEDLVILNLIEPHASNNFDTRKEWSCIADSGGLRARRLLAAQISLEHSI